MLTREKQLGFHIRSDDYFSTLATVLDLAGQILETEYEKIQRAKNDLLYLQENYKIVRK